MAPHLEKQVQPGQYAVDQFFSLYMQISPEKWIETYLQFIAQIKPGLNEIVIHLANDDEKMKAITVNHPDFGSAWRKRDYDFAISEQLKESLKKNNIQITWKQIQQFLRN